MKVHDNPSSCEPLEVLAGVDAEKYVHFHALTQSVAAAALAGNMGNSKFNSWFLEMDHEDFVIAAEAALTGDELADALETYFCHRLRYTRVSRGTYMNRLKKTGKIAVCTQEGVVLASAPRAADEITLVLAISGTLRTFVIPAKAWKNVKGLIVGSEEFELVSSKYETTEATVTPRYFGPRFNRNRIWEETGANAQQMCQFSSARAAVAQNLGKIQFSDLAVIASACPGRQKQQLMSEWVKTRTRTLGVDHTLQVHFAESRNGSFKFRIKPRQGVDKILLITQGLETEMYLLTPAQLRKLSRGGTLTITPGGLVWSELQGQQYSPASIMEQWVI